MDAPTELAAPSPVPCVTPSPAPSAKERQLAGLKRYPKGTKPPQLSSGRGGPSIKSLEGEVRRVLREKNWDSMRRLAASLVSRAIKGEPAALAFLGPRLWPILEDASRGARIVSQGVRLELPGGGTVSLVQSSAGAPTQPASPLVDMSPQDPTEGAHQPPMESAPSEEASTGGDPMPSASGGPLEGLEGDAVPRA